jgi:predicted DNA-binding transcriptional regulator AlpA
LQEITGHSRKTTAPSCVELISIEQPERWSKEMDGQRQTWGDDEPCGRVKNHIAGILRHIDALGDAEWDSADRAHVAAEIGEALRLVGLEIKRSGVDGLPAAFGRNKVLNTRDTCKFLGFSVAHWRRLRAKREAPPGVRIGTRIQGWRVGTLIEWLETRSQSVKD